MLEKELKVALSKDEYEKIEKLIKWEDVYDQINFYYAKAGNEDVKGTPTVRIRSKKKGMKLEVKMPVSSNEGSVKQHEEYAMDIDHIPGVIEKETLNKLLGRSDMEDVQLLGYLSTKRMISTKYPGTEIALDMNEYYGKVDYELEVEFIDELPKELLDELSFLNIDMNKKVTGKYRRFINERKVRGIGKDN
jgi:uncharacterized protein YjbK